MDNNKKKSLSMLIGGVITGIISVCLVVFRSLCVSELERMRSGSQQLKGIGFKDPYAPDYTIYLENLISKSMLTIVSFVLLTIVLVALFVIQKKNEDGKAAVNSAINTALLSGDSEETQTREMKDSENKKTVMDGIETTDGVSTAL